VATLVGRSVAAARPDPNRRYGVGYAMLDLTDTSRQTPAGGGQPQLPSRHLPTMVRYPTPAAPSGGETGGATPALANGPFPLIVFAHGFNSSPSVYAGLMHAWASAGYVVAAPSFPLTTMGGPLDEADVVNQPWDLSFVITSVLNLSAAPGDLLSHLVDARHIAAAGHSDGGETVMGIAANSCCLDRRLGAAIEMSGAELTYPGGSYFPGRTPPLLEVQGDQDPLNNYSNAVQIYNDAPAPKYFLTLVGGLHLEPFTTDTAHLIVSELCTIDFLDHYLKGRADGIPRLLADAASRGDARLEHAA
jgi:predicted dienelactone hydrolase